MGYRNHLRHKAAPAPMTNEEREMKEVREASSAMVYQQLPPRSQLTSKLALPLQDEQVKDQLLQLKEKDGQNCLVMVRSTSYDDCADSCHSLSAKRNWSANTCAAAPWQI